ncbi:probable serine/threonine-protein kinase kinX [Haliotis rubra]|uniref:probable serine/threonine-protein kinase kinX n=1 Tax=Haliotis rubra TaxID=36100 RepID=UPI001EE537DA|nr:probable serine/threonine-protein kinase kinX [Haliotis rubra]
MIRVWMLTWPVTPREQSLQDEEKRSIALELKAKRSKSFHALKAYFSNLGSTFKHPKNSEHDEADEMIETEADEEIEEEPAEVKREVPVTNVDVNKIIEEFQTEKAVTVEKVDIIESVEVVEVEPVPEVEPTIDIQLEEVETPKEEPVQEAEEEEPAQIEEENVETIDVFAMIKGFEHIKKDPNAKKVPKEFRKRTTVTLTKQ